MTEMDSDGCSMFETSKQSDYSTEYINRVDSLFEQHTSQLRKLVSPVYAAFPAHLLTLFSITQF